MSNPVNWFEIYVQDLDRAKAFYEAVLGIELNPLPGAPTANLACWLSPRNLSPMEQAAPWSMLLACPAAAIALWCILAAKIVQPKRHG